MPLIIEDLKTNERFRYPYYNVNFETHEDFGRYQIIPHGFRVSPSQEDSPDIPYFHQTHPSHPAESDPLG